MTTSAAATPTRSRGRWSLRRGQLPVVPALAVGLAAGAATEVGQGAVPTGWGLLVDSVAAWMLLATAVAAVGLGDRGSARVRRGHAVLVGGALLGLVAELGLVAGYYGWAAMVTGVPHSVTSVAVWTAAALVGGPVAGLCAAGWREGGRGRVASTAVVGAVLLVEGLRAVVTAPWLAPGGWTFAVLGVLCPLVLLRGRSRWAGLALTGGLTALGAGAFAALDALLRLL